MYRVVNPSFWDDAKVVDDFTPEDKYFYLYLLTNPHTNLLGCYQISVKQIARETGYNEETVNRLIGRFDMEHGVARYDRTNKELIVWRWHKYNWTLSPKLLASVSDKLNDIKTESFRAYVTELASEYLEGRKPDAIAIPYPYHMDTSVSVTVTDTDSVTVTNTVINNKNNKRNIKHKYGEYENVRLTDQERDNLVSAYGGHETSEAIRFLDEYIEMKGYKAKSHYLAIRKWVFDAVKEEARKKPHNTVDSWLAKYGSEE